MRTLLLLAMLVLGAVACTKKDETFCVNAIVEWAGNPAADGLGWVLRQDNDSTGPLRYFVPSNLDDRYKKTGLLVKACLYKTSEKVDCFCAAPPNKYRIVSISNR